MADLWPWIALGAYCWGVTSGIAWAAQWRPTIISIRTVMETARDD